MKKIAFPTGSKGALNMNMASMVKTAKSIVTANSPVLLVGTAIAGVVATGYLAAQGGYKARGIIDEAQEQIDHELNAQEKLQLTWLCYAAPVLTGASTVASVVGVHTIHTKRHAALAGLYAVASTKLDSLQEEAEKMLGPKKMQQINDATGQVMAERNPLRDNAEILMLGDGTELCHDEWSGRWFKGSHASIEAAFNRVNKILLTEGEASLNEFYDELGLDPIPMGASFGWPGGTLLEPRWGTVSTPDGGSAITFWFHEAPKEGRGV